MVVPISEARTTLLRLTGGVLSAAAAAVAATGSAEEDMAVLSTR